MIPISSSVSDGFISPIWCDQALSHSKVDGFVPHTQRVNFRVVSQRHHSGILVSDLLNLPEGWLNEHDKT